MTFDFKQWLIERGWQVLIDGETYSVLSKMCYDDALVKLEIAKDAIEAKIVRSHSIIFCGCSIPKTKQQAEILFELFEL